MADAVSYDPSDPLERNYFETLWRAANPSLQPEMGGAIAVPFFQKSQVDRGFLKQIWTMSCGETLNMRKEQFFTALRYITMAQNGELPLSKEHFNASKAIKLPFPKFLDIPLPTAPISTAPTPPTVSPQTIPYAITPDDHIKYHNLFLTYDTDKDGLLQGSEAVPVFSKSGLPQDLLRTIWTVADDDRDNALSPKEFAIAFHLIVCVSKRGLPVPATLPPPLRAFLLNAPIDPLKGSATSPTAPVVGVALSSPAPIGPPAKVSISDAFGSVEDSVQPSRSVMETNVTSTSFSPSFTPVSASVPSIQSNILPPRNVSATTESDSSELAQEVSAVRDASRKALNMHEASLAATERATSSMKELVTKLKGDRVALAAQLSAAECGLRDAEDAQSAVLRDIDSLRHEISDLSAKLGAASGETNKSRSALADLQGTKIALNAQVLALREELERLGLEETKNLGLLEKSLVVDTTATCRLKSISAEIAKVQQEEASLLSEIAVLREVASSFSIQKDAYLAKMTMIEEKVRQSQQTADATAEEVKRQEKKISEVLQENERLRTEKNEILKKLQYEQTGRTSTNQSTSRAVAGMASPLLSSQTLGYLSSIETPPPISESVAPRTIESSESESESVWDGEVADETPVPAYAALDPIDPCATSEKIVTTEDSVDPFTATATATFATSSVIDRAFDQSSKSLEEKVEDPFASVGSGSDSVTGTRTSFSTTPFPSHPDTGAPTSDDPFALASSTTDVTDSVTVFASGNKIVTDEDPFFAVAVADSGTNFTDSSFPSPFDKVDSTAAFDTAFSSDAVSVDSFAFPSNIEVVSDEVTFGSSVGATDDPFSSVGSSDRAETDVFSSSGFTAFSESLSDNVSAQASTSFSADFGSGFSADFNADFTTVPPTNSSDFEGFAAFDSSVPSPSVDPFASNASFDPAF